MDDRRVDLLARAAAGPGSRRGMLRLLAGGALSAALGRALPAAAEKGVDPGLGARCARNRDCSGAFRCRDGRCRCPRRRDACGSACCRRTDVCCNPLLGICRKPGEPCPR